MTKETDQEKLFPNIPSLIHLINMPQETALQAIEDGYDPFPMLNAAYHLNTTPRLLEAFLRAGKTHDQIFENTNPAYDANIFVLCANFMPYHQFETDKFYIPQSKFEENAIRTTEILLEYKYFVSKHYIENRSFFIHQCQDEDLPSDFLSILEEKQAQTIIKEEKDILERNSHSDHQTNQTKLL